MKLLILPFLFVFTVKADACKETDLISATYPLQCDTLTISKPINLSGTSPIDIEVIGNVVIKANITLNGSHGNSINADMTPGASGGPAASPGGGRGFFEPEENPDCPPYGPAGVTCPFAGTRGGEDQRSTPNCDGGGSGGGFSKAGDNGSVCQSSGITPSPGGNIFNYSAIETDLRGGFGGGSGGGVAIPTAGGGGGGGAIRITTQGTLSITNKGSIAANGGTGANSVNINGAGGGGSGGVIILEAGSFDLQGTLSAQGGAGGRAPNGGHGGQGSPGLIRLKDAEGVKDFIGVKLPPKPMELNSSISCGTIASKNEEDSQTPFLFQILVPLFACVGLSMIRKKFQSQA